jgi:hypothetical protein
LGKRIEGENAVGGDFVIGFRCALLAEGAHDKKRDMVALRHLSVEEQAVEQRRRKNFDIAFFEKLAGESLGRRLSGLDPAAGQLPPARVSMRDEKDSLVFVDDEAADAERNAAGKAPIKVESPADQGLNCLPYSVYSHWHVDSGLIYNSIGESDEFTESVNYEDDVCSALALIPCATDAEFLEKLRWLLARDVAQCGKPSFGGDFGCTLVALSQHFGNCQPRRRLRHCRPGAVVRSKPPGR